MTTFVKHRVQAVRNEHLMFFDALGTKQHPNPLNF